MNLPNDVSRCAAIIRWPSIEYEGDAVSMDVGERCPHQFTCLRRLQMIQDHEAASPNLPSYSGISVISNCLVNGEYTLRIET